MQGDLDSCLKLLIDTDRLPEAAMFARTYCPSQVENILAMWKAKMGNTKAAQSLASPAQYPNLFPDIEQHIQAEKVWLMQKETLKRLRVAVYTHACAAANTSESLSECTAECAT